VLEIFSHADFIDCAINGSSWAARSVENQRRASEHSPDRLARGPWRKSIAPTRPLRCFRNFSQQRPQSAPLDTAATKCRPGWTPHSYCNGVAI